MFWMIPQLGHGRPMVTATPPRCSGHSDQEVSLLKGNPTVDFDRIAGLRGSNRIENALDEEAQVAGPQPLFYIPTYGLTASPGAGTPHLPEH